MSTFTVYGAGYGGDLLAQGRPAEASGPAEAVRVARRCPLLPGETFVVVPSEGSYGKAHVFRVSKKGNLKSVVKDPSARGRS